MSKAQAPPPEVLMGRRATDSVNQIPTGPMIAAELVLECDRLEKLLLEKNKAYGNSALAPRRIFSKADTLEQLNVRIDDKLARIEQGQADNEDAELDLIGYLILRRIARRLERV